MRKATVTLLCVLCALCLMSSAFAGGMEISGVGAKAKAMGGAFRAIANDWSAAYYNPAGLFYVTENQLTVNEVITHNRFQYAPNVTYGGYPVGFYQGDIYNRYEILTNPTLGGFFKLPIKGRDVVLGLAVFQPFDQNVSWQVFGSLNNGAAMPGQQIEHNFDAVAINAVAAVELIENKLSLGISAGVLKGDLVYGGFFLRENPADPNADYYTRLVHRPYELITEWQHSDGNGLAPNLRAGLLFKPTERLSFGASFAMKATMTVDGDSYFYYYMPDNFYYHNSDDVFNPDSANYILSSGVVYEAEAKFETEITMPAQVGAGIAYQVTDKLLVAGDFEYTLWSAFEGYQFDYTFTDANITRNAMINGWMIQDMSVPVDWKDVFRGSVGLEYAYSDKVLMRAGYSADQTPVEQGTLHPAFFDPGLKHRFNLGLGLIFENTRLDFATEYVHYSESGEGGNTYLEDSNGVTDGVVDNMSGIFKGSTFESVIQFTIRF